MANGLRKLIRKTRRNFINPSKLSRRLNSFGPRLKVEELEERIAPAAVDIVPGEFATWDAGSGDGAWDADDGFMALATGSTVNKITITDITDGAADDTGGPSDFAITVTDSDGAGAETIIIATNKAIDSIDLSGLDAGTTTLTLIVASGVTTTEDAGTLDQDFTINSVAYTVTAQAATAASVGDPAVAVTGEVFTGDTNAAVGAITIGATDFTALVVDATIVSAGAGTISTLDFSDSTDNTGTNFGGTLISGSGNNIDAITVGDDITGLTVTGNLNGAVAADQITGAIGVTGNITANGDFTIANGIGTGGDFTVSGDLAGDVITSAGAIAGDLTITGDITGAVTGDDGISGDISGALISGNITVTDGDFSGTITSTGNITGDITVDNAGTGDFTGAIVSGGTLGNVDVGDDIGGDITAAGTFARLTSDTGDILATSAIQAGGTIADITLTAGSVISGATITTTDGDLSNIDAAAFAGTLNIDDALTDADFTGAIGGSITAGNIVALDTSDGSLTGTVISDVGGIATVNIDANDSANGAMTAAASITSATTIGTITVGKT